jgi:hypothetical protein
MTSLTSFSSDPQPAGASRARINIDVRIKLDMFLDIMFLDKMFLDIFNRCMVTSVFIYL